MKRIKVITITFIGIVSLFALEAQSFMMPPVLPMSPSLDPAGDVALGGEGTGKVILSKVDDLQKMQTDVLSAIKGGDFKFPFKLDSSLFHKKGDGLWITSSRKVESSKIADIKDEDSIVEAFRTLFLTYPADVLAAFPQNPEAVKKAYKEKGLEFGNDAMIEMYITVRDLEEKMQTLKAEFDTLSTCYVQGESSNSNSCESASPNDEELGVWTNYYKLNAIYDSILKITEELMVLRAQYEVAQAIQAGIEPEMPESEQSESENTDKVSYNDISTFRQTTSLAYAQMFSGVTSSLQPAENVNNKSGSSSVSNVTSNTFGVFELTNNNAAALQVDPNLETVQAKQYDVKSPFAGSADQFQALALSNNVYATLQKAISVHNLKQQMPEYKRVFDEYNKMIKLHDKSIEQLMKSEKCVINYLGKYYKDPLETWLGQGCKYSTTNGIVCDSNRSITADNLQNLLPGDELCGDDKNKICSNYGINKYSNREGLSGWLISAYKTGKAAKTLDLTSDDFATNLSEENASTSVSDMENKTEQYSAENQSGLSDSSFLRPSEEEVATKQNRELELLSWQLGSEAAKAISNDMKSSAPLWGEVKNPYKLWNDEKYFYDQYLAEKYQNMELYIRDLDLRTAAIQLAQSINDSLQDSGGWADILVSLDEVKSYNKTALDNLLPLSEEALGNDTRVSDVSLVSQQISSAATSLRSDMLSQKSNLESRKTSVYSSLDSANIGLNDMKKAYNTALEDKQNAEANIEYQKQVISISQDKKSKSGDYISNFENIANSEISTSEDEVSTATNEAKTALSNVDSQRDRIDELNSSLSNLNDDIVRLENNYAANASLLEYRNDKALKSALNKRAIAADTLSVIGSDFWDKGLDFSSANKALKQKYLRAIISIAENALQDAKDKAIESIEEGKRKIDNLGQNKYTASGHANILSIHKEIMDSIQNNPVKVSTEGVFQYMIDIRSAAKLAQDLFYEALISRICQNDSCYQADTRYFVGLDPDKEDFMAPKAIVNTYTPPLREVVHFDSTDFDGVVKSDTWMITKADFLNYGQEVPQIWQDILGEKGFVERSVDVAEILSHKDGSADVLTEKGEYPCSAAGYNVYLSGGKYYVYGNDEGSMLDSCQDISAVSVYLNNKVSIVLKDGTRKNGEYAKPSTTSNGGSELAVLLQYKDNNVTGGLTFSDSIQNIMRYYEELENKTDADEDDFNKAKNYNKMLLARNQFGDYLNFVETEMSYQDSVDMLKVKVDQVRDTLKQQLAVIDYVPADDFDLSDEQTYNEIITAIEEGKNKLVSSGNADISKLQPLNDTLSEKIEKLKDMVGSLQTDNEELVLLSDNTKNDSALSEKIKSKRVDAEARNKYDEEAEDAFNDNLNNFEEPYCAVYN